jgi:hypothetical protein
MTRIPLFILAAVLLLAGCERSDDLPNGEASGDTPIQYMSFGEEISAEGLAIAPADLAAEPTAYANQDVRVEGTVVSVCQQAGCWLTLENPAGEPIRVHVPKDDDGEYLWTLPMDLGPRMAIVEGTAFADTLSVDEQRHYVEDAGGSQAELDAITEAQASAYVIARGILVEQPSTPLPPDAGPETAPETSPQAPVQGDPAESPAGAAPQGTDADSPAGA